MIIKHAILNESYKKSSVLIFDFEEIGMTDSSFFFALSILYTKEKSDNIILKFFNFYPNEKTITYFEQYKKNLDEFIFDNKANLYNNKVVVTPITINEHFSLFMFFNNECYLLDYGQSYCLDTNRIKIKNEISQIWNKVNSFILLKKYDPILIKTIFSSSEDINVFTSLNCFIFS